MGILSHLRARIEGRGCQSRVQTRSTVLQMVIAIILCIYF